MQLPSIRTSLLASCLCAAALGISSCASNAKNKNHVAWTSPVTMPDVAVAQAPFDLVEVKWKERFREPYVYIENDGDYRAVGHRIADLMEIVADQGVPPALRAHCPAQWNHHRAHPGGLPSQPRRR